MEVSGLDKKKKKELNGLWIEQNKIIIIVAPKT